MHPAIIIGTFRSLIVDVAMGQIPRSTERISSFKNEIISVNVSKTKKTNIFSALVLRCSRWNVLIPIRYLCNLFIFKKKDGKIKSIQNVTRIKNVKRFLNFFLHL